ncbi:class I SAM-dependent methyltransferase [Haliangium sp.]|uniref:class I SAM-dependent methyltransferase n=1 Tax=Haliangium sp. TaxID=2663208 RepID=UPI003D1198EF
MDPAFVSLLRCPACLHPEMSHRGRKVTCARCALELDGGGDFLDLVEASRRGSFTASTPEQSFMESELVARVYERFWRPAFVRVVAGKGAGARAGGFTGELFIHKNSLAMEDREGPWLDLSCGTGLFTRAMAAAVSGEVVVGVDVSTAMLHTASRRSKGYGHVSLVRADAHHLPFRDGVFGGVNNAGALHAYDDPEQVFCEVLRVLRPGGVYVGSTFARARSLVAGVAARVAGIRRFDPLEMHAWLSRVGFADYEEIQFGDSFIFRVRKP